MTKNLLGIVVVILMVSFCAIAASQDAAPSLDDQLFKAVGNGDTAAVTQLLAQGAHVDAQDPNGYTPLIAACAMGFADVVKLLLDKGADPAIAAKNGQTALHFAAMTGNTEEARLLLDKNAPAEVNDQSGLTPLMYGVVSNKVELVNLLVAHGANVEARDPQGFTALMAASGGLHRHRPGAARPRCKGQRQERRWNDCARARHRQQARGR